MPTSLAAEPAATRRALAGKAYFLSQGEPLPLWDLVNRILAAATLPPVTRTVPVAGVRGRLGCWKGCMGCCAGENEPPMTRFLARELSTAHWFDISAARRDLGYEPLVSLDEGLSRLKQSLQTGSSSTEDSTS